MTEDQLNNYLQFLSENEFIVTKKSCSAFTAQLNVLGQKVTVDCELPEFFPYVFPIVRLSEESRKTFRGIPHIIKDNSLCLFNSADAQPNFLAPRELILSTLRKAEEVLRKGQSGENEDDFQVEILNYWGKDNRYDIRFFSPLPSNPSRIYVSYAKDSFQPFYIATTNKSDNESLFKHISYKDLETTPEKGIFIPLTSGFSSHDVSTEKKMWSVIEQRTSTQTKRKIIAELSSIDPHIQHFFIVSFPDQNQDNVLVAWRGSSMSRLDGFRRGHISPFLYWNMQQETGAQIIKASVTPCMQPHLFYRGSYGYEFRFRSAAIVGCGSVGSHLAKMLSSMGTDKFLLIDKETLEVNNIARHVCGFSEVGLPKACALKLHLEQQNPNVYCDVYQQDAFSEVKRRSEEINQCDALFIAVGELPLEAYILNLAIQGIITVPIVITWVEPRCYAAHLVYIKQYECAFEKLVCRETMTYRDSVICDASEFVLHESGCQSGFVPYSGLDVQNYLSVCLHMLSRIGHQDSIQGNYHMIWIGELSEARRNKITINPDYSNSKDYSVFLKRFD